MAAARWQRAAPSDLPRTLSARRLLQVWILLSIATLSALPWMIVEFKKADYSVHYQGERASGVGGVKRVWDEARAGWWGGVRGDAAARPPCSAAHAPTRASPPPPHPPMRAPAWFIAGIFVILAVSASIYEVAMHLEYYSKPRLQIRVVRILCMVPIYAIDSWLSLRFKEARWGGVWVWVCVWVGGGGGVRGSGGRGGGAARCSPCGSLATPDPKPPTPLPHPTPLPGFTSTPCASATRRLSSTTFSPFW